MSEEDKIRFPENEKLRGETETAKPTIEDVGLNPLSSAEPIKSRETGLAQADRGFTVSKIETLQAPIDESLPDQESDEQVKDPIFEELAAPKLPALEKENRARLQMQSPNRLYFYWSIKNSPFQTLQKIFGGDTGNYQLVAKFVNQTRFREEIFPIEAEGSWWFNAEANASYLVEIGFYAPNRPFIRVMFSNAVETPRKSPSPRQASDADWAVSARNFAEVLDNSGFVRDAFEVALAGDDAPAAENATHDALYQLVGVRQADFEFGSDEVRFALLLLAAGIPLEDLRGHISAALFTILQERGAELSAEKSLAALQENFDVFADEITGETVIGPAVFGASLINFPERRKRFVPKTLSPKLLSKLSPVSSSVVADS